MSTNQASRTRKFTTIFRQIAQHNPQWQQNNNVQLIVSRAQQGGLAEYRLEYFGQGYYGVIAAYYPISGTLWIRKSAQNPIVSEFLHELFHETRFVDELFALKSTLGMHSLTEQDLAQERAAK